MKPTSFFRRIMLRVLGRTHFYAPQIRHQPTAAVPSASPEWREDRNNYLFIEGNQAGALVSTNMANVACPRCKALVTDETILDAPNRYGDHRCGTKKTA